MALDRYFLIGDDEQTFDPRDPLPADVKILFVKINTTEKDKEGRSISYRVPYQVTVEGREYIFLDVGSSNVAYHLACQKSIYKEPYGSAKAGIEEKRKENSPYLAVNDPKRLVAIHQSADSKNKDKYRVVDRIDKEMKKHCGYIMPCFLSDEKNAKKLSLTEDQRISAVIDFFEETNGRILCDAYISNNLLFYNNEVCFPDVGDALELGLNEVGEPKSPTSYHAWYREGNMRSAYLGALQNVRTGTKLPRLAKTIAALITLKEKFPDLCESVLWLKSSANDALRNKLADVFQGNNKPQKMQNLRQKNIKPPNKFSKTGRKKSHCASSGRQRRTFAHRISLFQYRQPCC